MRAHRHRHAASINLHAMLQSISTNRYEMLPSTGVDCHGLPMQTHHSLIADSSHLELYSASSMLEDARLECGAILRRLYDNATLLIRRHERRFDRQVRRWVPVPLQLHFSVKLLVAWNLQRARPPASRLSLQEHCRGGRAICA